MSGDGGGVVLWGDLLGEATERLSAAGVDSAAVEAAADRGVGCGLRRRRLARRAVPARHPARRGLVRPDVGAPGGGRAAAVRAGLVGVPHAGSLRGPQGADPRARDRDRRRLRPRRTAAPRRRAVVRSGTSPCWTRRTRRVVRGAGARCRSAPARRRMSLQPGPPPRPRVARRERPCWRPTWGAGRGPSGWPWWPSAWTWRSSAQMSRPTPWRWRAPIWPGSVARRAGCAWRRARGTRRCPPSYEDAST